MKLLKNCILFILFFHSSYIRAHRIFHVANLTRHPLKITYLVPEGPVNVILKPNFYLPTVGVLGPIFVSKYSPLFVFEPSIAIPEVKGSYPIKGVFIAPINSSQLGIIPIQ